MKLGIYCMSLISLCCMSLIANGKITLSDQWFLSEKISGNWHKEIPSNAIPFKLKNEICNLDTVRGKKGQEKDECVIYNQFYADHDGRLSIGLGCDWWMQVFCNDIEYCNTMTFGNGSNFYSPQNHPLLIPVKKGRNLLAVKVIRGNQTFTFAAGQINPPVPETESIDIAPKLVPRRLPHSKPSVSSSGSSYQLLLLGDTHFDGPYETYHRGYSHPDEKFVKYLRTEMALFETMWQERSPRLLKAAADQITDKTFGIIQLGDLVNGYCGNAQIHSRMLLDALAALKKEFGSLPVLPVAGNHDVRTNPIDSSEEEKYRQTLFPYLSQELKTKGNLYQYLFRQKFRLLIF